MARGIELIERSTFAVNWVRVAAGKVVLGENARHELHLRHRITEHGMFCPGRHIRGSKRSRLSGDFCGVVHIGRDFSEPAKADRLEIEFREAARFTAYATRYAP